MKDYYASLGVTRQAEDRVIKAAYRALAQHYHPDRFTGSKDEAHRKMAEINEAYGVLSDPTERRRYDAECSQTNEQENDFDAGDDAAADGVGQLDADWKVAIDFYPDLISIERDLVRTSKRLAFMFRLFIVTEKQYKERAKIAARFQTEFLENYFGRDPAILHFAKTLIALGRKDAAKALNSAVRVLGEDIDAGLVVTRINKRFGLSEQHSRTQTTSTRCPKCGTASTVVPPLPSLVRCASCGFDFKP